MIVDNDTPWVVIVPARGGSKGIPNKNLRMIAGKPLIWWTMDSVHQAKMQMRLVVTTDDLHISAFAKASGAEVVERPKELATDESPTDPALMHALEMLERPEALEHVILLQATSPVRFPGTLDSAIQTYSESKADSLVGVVPSSSFLWKGEKSTPVPLYDLTLRKRRQDLPSTDCVFRETGSIYITRRDALLATRNRLSGKVILYPMREDEGIDIDVEADFLDAERIIMRESHDHLE